MNKQLSEQLSGEIAYIIASQAPYIEYTAVDVEKTKREITGKQLKWVKGDCEVFHVVTAFLKALHVLEKADESYLKALYQNARKYTVEEFYGDPFLKKVHVPDEKIGEFYLTNATYGRGEFFQYDQPDLSAEIVVPKLAFCTGEVSFATIYEGNIPWMSACPSEINSMKTQMEQAHGKVLVLGLGLGYYPFVVAQKNNVEKVDIVEIEPTVIQLFQKHILPQFEQKEKIKVIKADAFAFLNAVKEGDYDFVFADIWENQFDGSKAYVKIAPHESRLPHTQFTYWLEEQIKWVLRER